MVVTLAGGMSGIGQENVATSDGVMEVGRGSV